MHSTPVVVLSAVTIVAALGLVGCGQDVPPAADPMSSQAPGSSPPEASTAAPLPAPDELTGVLYRLADTSVPGEQKVFLVQYATVEDIPALTDFGEALKANGFDPLTVDATDLSWAGAPGHVTANVTMGSPDPKVNPFTFPMEFSPIGTTWQLSKRTADELLPMIGAPRPTG